MEELVPRHFKAPAMEAYDGTSDPFDHIESFRSHMLLQGISDALMRKTFLTTSGMWQEPSTLDSH